MKKPKKASEWEAAVEAVHSFWGAFPRTFETGQPAPVARFSSRVLWRVDRWLVKVDVSEKCYQRWAGRESEAMARTRGIEGLARSRRVTVDKAGKRVVMVGPWVEGPKPISVPALVKVRDLYDALAAVGIMIRDDLWTMLVETEAGGILLLDLGCFLLATPEEARHTNGYRLIDVARRQVEARHAC